MEIVTNAWYYPTKTPRVFHVETTWKLVLKSRNMEDWGGEFSVFKGIHVRIDKKIDTSIFVKPIPTKFGRQVHLQDLSQMKLTKQVLVTSFGQHHVTN